MPIHDMKCPHCQRIYENVVVLRGTIQACEVCVAELEIYWRRAPMGFVQKDICYDSPIDGRPITSKTARTEDLRRNECVEWDPGMKQDAERARREREASLARAVDSSVDEFVATAPARKLEKLEQEIRAGVSVDVERASPATT